MGVLCQGHDHIGHRSSPGGRTEVRSLREYTAPVLVACKRMRSEHPDLPLFLMGHSMGGLIALTAALTSPALFDGLLLTGPSILCLEASSSSHPQGRGQPSQQGNKQRLQQNLSNLQPPVPQVIFMIKFIDNCFSTAVPDLMLRRLPTRKHGRVRLKTTPSSITEDTNLVLPRFILYI